MHEISIIVDIWFDLLKVLRHSGVLLVFLVGAFFRWVCATLLQMAFFNCRARVHVRVVTAQAMVRVFLESIVT